MERRRLGRDGFELTRLGFGAWSIGGGGWAYRGTAGRDESSIAAMRRALELGVTWVDTAPTYGAGHSEELVGRLLREPVDGLAPPLVFTKCGRRWDSAAANPRPDLRPGSIRCDCEAGLRRLGVDAVDLLQIHWPDDHTGTPIEESWGELLRLKEEGKTRCAGVCNFDEALLARCDAVGHVDSLQTPLSLISRGSATRILPWAASHGVAVLVYSPLQIGLLTESEFTRERIAALAPEDWRRRHPDYQSPRLERNLAVRDALHPVATAHSTTVAAVAIAWTLSWPQVTGAIVGASSPRQVEGWAAAADVALSGHELDGIGDVLIATGAGEGPTRPG